MQLCRMFVVVCMSAWTESLSKAFQSCLQESGFKNGIGVYALNRSQCSVFSIAARNMSEYNCASPETTKHRIQKKAIITIIRKETTVY